MVLISWYRTPRNSEPQSPPENPVQDVPVSLPPEDVTPLLASKMVPASNMISRLQTKPAETNPAAPEVTQAPEPKVVKERSPVSSLVQQYVQPADMVSLAEELDLTNDNAVSGVNLLTDEQGVSEMMAKSYIRKSAMLSKESESFSAGWITYANRKRSPGFISDIKLIDEGDTQLKIPGLRVDNPDVMARAMYYIREAEIKMKEGDNEQAMTLYTQALAVYPEMTYANRQMGRLSLIRGDYDNAIRFFKDALDADEALGDTLNQLGNAYLYAGKGEEALQSFSASLEAGPLSLDPLFNMGLALRTLKRLDEAREKLDEYLEVDKFDARVYRELAVIDMLEGDNDEALNRLHTAIALDGRWYTPQLDAAIIYAEKGAYVKAMELLEKALEYAPAWVVYQVYGLPALKEARLIPESRKFEAALAEKARSRM